MAAPESQSKMATTLQQTASPSSSPSPNLKSPELAESPSSAQHRHQCRVSVSDSNFLSTCSPTTSPKLPTTCILVSCEPHIVTQTPTLTQTPLLPTQSAPAPSGGVIVPPLPSPLPPVTQTQTQTRAVPVVSATGCSQTPESTLTSSCSCSCASETRTRCASHEAAARRAHFLERLYSADEPYAFGVSPPLLWEPSTLREFELSEQLEHTLRAHDCYESEEGMNTRCDPQLLSSCL